MRTIAISACLVGNACRYDGRDNKNDRLLEKFQEDILIPFCPEEYAFGTPRPTMDLIETSKGIRAFSNYSDEDLSEPIIAYARAFFDTHNTIELCIGKDRSPSCGVCSARVYDASKNLSSSNATGLMIQEALRRQIPCIDAEKIVLF